MWFLTLKITWLNCPVSLDELFTSKSAGQERLELTRRRAPSPGRPLRESLFPGVSHPRYISATMCIFVIWNLEISPGCMSYFFSHWEKKATQKQRLGNETYHFSLNTRYKLLIHISEWFCFIYVIAGRTCRGPLLFGVLKWLDFFLFIQNMIIDFFWQCLIWKVINLHAVGPFNH